MNIWGLLVVYALLLVGYTGVEAKLRRSDRRIARVERKLDLILDHLGLRHGDPDLARVAALLNDGKKIAAIKAYREITDADLKEAKEAVERMTQP
ncbi:ribosomal protein L7/L12 [Streptomyces sp. NPDC005708]|uniref:ribosomal protein L7/L12 n=1 Tax=unclassified Streptomyces TaxID=2593676 RepID=UPI0033CE932F